MQDRALIPKMYLGHKRKFREIANLRPTFYISDGDKNFPIRAAGILPCTEDGVFLINEDDHWSDFGGKTDAADRSVHDTACRECREESDGKLLFSQDQLPRAFVNGVKYALYPVKLNEGQVKVLTDNPVGHKNKTVKFFKREEMSGIKLHPRLQTMDLSKIVSSLS